MLSIIIPLRNEAENLAEILSHFNNSLSKIDHEVILVNDFSIDDTFKKSLNNTVRFSYDNFEPEMVVFLFKTIMKDYQIRFNVRTDLEKDLHKTFSDRYTKYIA